MARTELQIFSTLLCNTIASLLASRLAMSVMLWVLASSCGAVGGGAFLLMCMTDDVVDWES